MTSTRFMLAVGAALAIGVGACGSTDDNGGSTGGSSGGSKSSAQLGGSLNGAGATFPQPVYQEWAARFQKDAGTTVNYQGIGSGGGVAQFTAGTLGFGAPGAAVTHAGIAGAAKKGGPVALPAVLAGRTGSSH